jgi:hypothetical protein
MIEERKETSSGSLHTGGGSGPLGQNEEEQLIPATSSSSSSSEDTPSVGDEGQSAGGIADGNTEEDDMLGNS